MGNYGQRSIQLPWLNTRFSVGDKITSSQLQQLIYSSVVFSSMRWCASVFMGKGWTFSSGELSFFIPASGTGRQIFQPWFCSNDSSSTTPSTVRWSSQSTLTTIGQTTTTSGSNLTVDSALSAYNKRIIYGPVYATSNSARAYRDPRQYGCGRVRWISYTGASPICFGVWPYSISYSYNAGLEDYAASDGTVGANFISSPSFSALGAGILRVCEKMLDTAETMPVPIVTTPIWSATSGTAFNDASLSVCRVTNRSRWVPIVNLGRPRALWVAFYKNSSSAVTLRTSFNGYDYSVSTSNAAETRIYVNGTSYYLYAIPISAEMLAASTRQVGGLPMHFVTISVGAIAQGVTAWIGDRP